MPYTIRGPNRPNPLNIKPYSKVFDHFDDVKDGWLTGKETGIKTERSDDRFVEQKECISKFDMHSFLFFTL